MMMHFKHLHESVQCYIALNLGLEEHVPTEEQFNDDHCHELLQNVHHIIHL
jgi:hypothetical protein